MAAAIAEILFGFFLEVVCHFTAVVLVRLMTFGRVGFECWPPRHPKAIILPDEAAQLIGVIIIILLVVIAVTTRWLLIK